MNAYRTPQLPDGGHLRAPKKFMAMLGEPYAPELAEDSLTVNIWTPSSTDGGQRPVLFFIHGGGYVFGQAGQPAFDGESLARRHDVVFISVTHRLNAFGFLYLDSIARGHGSAVPLLTGWTLDEVTLFSGQDIDASIPVPEMFQATTPGGQRTGFDPSAGGLAAISSWGGGDATAVIAARRALFPAESDAVLARRLLSDIMFRRPQERVALARDSAGSATYLYRFEWASPVMRPLGAPHCAGIAPFFGNEQLVAFTRDNPDARALAETMSSALSAFMRTGDPATSGGSWPRYRANTRAVMIFDQESRVLLDPERSVRLALEELNPRSLL